MASASESFQDMSIFEGLPMELRYHISEIAIKGKRYQDFRSYLKYREEKSIRIPEHDFSSGTSLDIFYRYFASTIGKDILIDHSNPNPPHYMGHFASRDRPSYYQRTICSIWQIYIELAPNYESENVKDTVIEMISNICYDYMYHYDYMLDLPDEHDENIFTKDYMYEALYRFVRGLMNEEKDVVKYINDDEDYIFDFKWVMNSLIDDCRNNLYAEPLNRLSFYYHEYDHLYWS